MGDYLLVFLDNPGERAETLSRGLRDEAGAAGLSVRDLGPGAWIALWGPHPPALVSAGAWTLIGDVIPRARTDTARVPAGDPHAFERKLLIRFWGRFVGVRRTGADAGGFDAVLRDPSGAHEAVVWSQSGVTTLASDWPERLLRRLAPPWSLRVDRLAGLLRDPLASLGELALGGPTAVMPGTLQPLPLPQPAVPLWRPLDVVTRGAARRWTVEAAADHLRDAVDEAVTGLAGLGGDLACEVSGGLDSSVVAASLARRPPRPVRLWLNAHGTAAESDERPYLTALTQTLGVAAESVPLATAPLTSADLLAVPGGLRPGFNGMDLHQDRAWAARIVAAGASAVLTGKGGDSVLVQGATVEVLADLWCAEGWRALGSRDLLPLAALTETSIWTLISQARRLASNPAARSLRNDSLMRAGLPLPAPHPWLEGLSRFGPAKTQQVAGVINNMGRHAPSAQSLRIDPRHPLCALPVIEACLALPTPVLVHGGRDRGLARTAFADRLPQTIRDRRSKGNLTRLYGEMVEGSLGTLRPWLIEGRLSALGILDRAALEARLTPESLMWRGGYAEIMTAATLEAWVRTWEARLTPGA